MFAVNVTLFKRLTDLDVRSEALPSFRLTFEGFTLNPSDLHLVGKLNAADLQLQISISFVCHRPWLQRETSIEWECVCGSLETC